MGPRRMVGGLLRPAAGPARAGYGKERWGDIEARPSQRIERELRRRGEASGSCYGARPGQLGAGDIGQAVAEAADQLRGGVTSVVVLVQPEILHPEIGGEVHHQSRPGGEDLAGNPGRLTVFQAEEDDVPA